MWNFICVTLIILCFCECAKNTTTSTLSSSSVADIDIGRAHQVIPRLHLRGNGFKHGSGVLNNHLKNVKGLITRDCDTFSNSELEDILVALETLSVKEFGEIYEKKNDNRNLPSSVHHLHKEHDILKQLREMNHSDTLYLSNLARDRKCTEIVMRYAHHLTDDQRRNLHNLGFVEALPLLPTLSFREELSGSHHTHISKMIIDGYTKTMAAIQCHVTVNADGCPAEDFESCLSICPGIPNPPESLIANCRATCTEFCRDADADSHVGSKVTDTSTVPILVESKINEPPYWGGSWQVVMSRNTTNPDGSNGGFRACMRWYDWSRFSLRTDCTRNGVTTISLHVRENLYQIFTSPTVSCFVTDLEITPVSPYWLQEGARFVGRDKINDIETYVWDKKEPEGDSHFYKVAISDGRPVQMLTTGRFGEKNQKDYINYLEMDLEPDIFQPPPSCDQAKKLQLVEMLSLSDVVIDI